MISVIVPIYNTEKYLEKCIGSIIAQTYEDLEIILVDDGSTDSSGSICDAYAKKDARIRVIHKENGGLVSARQAGLAIAGGEYIGYVDSDDWIEPDMYRTLYEAAVAGDADIVAEGAVDDFDGECVTAFNQIPAGSYASPDERKRLYEGMLCRENFFCPGIQPYLWNKLFRRGLVLGHMNKIPRKIRVGEDAAAVYPMLAMAESIAVLDAAHYHYCHRKNSMMLENIDENREYDNAVLLDYFLKKTFMELGVYELFKEQLYRYKVNNMLTRAYGMFADAEPGGGMLFPFPSIREGDSVVIYGAGALGRAVYEYAAGCGKLKVKALADRQAGLYKKMGLRVDNPDDVSIESADKVIVAIFRESSYLAVKKRMTDRGVNPGRIIWPDTEKLKRFFPERQKEPSG